ncbi:MAG: hypothetical protein PHH47_05160 [Gallionella sp.]|nr:hypothetical protein [Gallionella sp.]MDD4945471.1 hypothetical protein [Gallionella sp.]MDD5612212.1 hypothetical protein [Gallionella sp.]
MPISLFVDSNAWDAFFDRGVDLRLELPSDQFSIQITREAEFEILHMPSDKRKYVETALNDRMISTDTYFGLYDESLPPEQQRVAGLDCGRFASEEELAILRTERSSVGPTMRPTGLYKNEADVSLAARSTVSVVLTCDGKKALKRAKTIHGGTIVDLKKWNAGELLATFIRAELFK